MQKENINIKIDSRETKIYNSISDRDLDIYKDFITFSSEQLDLGDIHICFKDIILVFERKTVSDLLASVTDGRLHEQKCRLLANFKPSQITYIIEGDNIISSNNNSQNLLSGIYYHSMYRDGIHIVFTKNIEETVTFLLILATKCCINSDKFISNTSDYISNIKIKSKKIDNIDKDTCYLLQLSQIPSISYKIAKNIQNIYPTLRILLKTLDETDDKEKLLSNIDNIGKNKANKILDYLGYL